VDWFGSVVDKFEGFLAGSVVVQKGAKVHQGGVPVEVDSELVSGEGDWGSFDVNVYSELFHLVVFDFYHEAVLEPSARVVEHGDHDSLGLFFVEGAMAGLAHDADAFVVGEVHFLAFVEEAVSYEGLSHLGGEGLLLLADEALFAAVCFFGGGAVHLFQVVDFLDGVEVLSQDFVLAGEVGCIFDDDFHLPHLVDFAVVELYFFELGVDDLFIFHVGSGIGSARDGA
jgi:hypothetical protein